MSNYTIQTGLWVNYGSAPALGATVTVSIRWGNYLIAALSSLVGWAGASAWSILSYALHQRLAAAKEKDVLDQQLQVHFRTAGSFLDSWLDGLGLHKAWNGRTPKVKRRTLTVSLLALVLFVVFMAAGVFVAEVATKSYQDVLVLAAPNDCGDMYFEPQEVGGSNYSVWLNEWNGYINDANFWARNYARETYYESRGRDSAFSMPKLPFVGSETPCPYTNGTTCFGPKREKGPAWTMDTGLLDSHIHFGMNAPPENRVTWRKTATCAVVDPQNLTTKPYQHPPGYLERDDNNTYIGILQQFDEDLGYESNLMFEIPQNLMYERTGFFSQRGMWTPGMNDGQDKAITGYPFNRTDADMVMVTTTQGLMFYYQPVDDPYFMAHKSMTNDEYAYDMNATTYYPSYLFGLMVCTEQHQICNPHTGECTPLGGTLKTTQEVVNNTIHLNDAQLATAIRINWNMQLMLSQSARGTANLMIAEKNGVRGGAAVPPNQWIKEVEVWFAAALAGTQESLLSWIAKPWPKGHPETMYNFVNLTALDIQYEIHNKEVLRHKQGLCRNQLIRSNAAVQNFSVLALVVVMVLCTALIITALVLPGCVSHLRERCRRKGLELSAAAEAGRVARLADAKYNMLAMALRGAGVEGWEKGGTSDIPVTKGSVTVCPPMEKDGLAAYPCTSCAVCRVPTSGSDSDSDTLWGRKDKKPELKLDVKKVSGGSSDLEKRQNSGADSLKKLDRQMTEFTLVESPVDMDGTGDDRSGTFSIPELDRITSLSPAPPIPAKARTRSR